jgi:coproporphyrinogen III oxidase-like Fe-S oxidoreductase
MYRSLLLNLQIKSGLDRDTFRARFNADPLDVFSSLLSTLGEYGCIEHQDRAICLSKYGAYFVEDVCDFIIDSLLKEESDTFVRTSHSGGVSIHDSIAPGKH